MIPFQNFPQRLRESLKPIVPPDMDPEDATWWEKARQPELEKARWKAIAQAFVMVGGIAAVGYYRHPERLTQPKSWAAYLVFLAFMYGVSWWAGREVLREGAKEMLKQHQLRKALLAEPDEPDPANPTHAELTAGLFPDAPPSPARRLDRHDIA